MFCLIGSRAVRLLGTAIPNFSIVAAGLIVTKSLFEMYRLYAGYPANPIKVLDSNLRNILRCISFAD
jgi:tetrahydrodipicolinate N-succinyltransferase